MFVHARVAPSALTELYAREELLVNGIGSH